MNEAGKSTPHPVAVEPARPARLGSLWRTRRRLAGVALLTLAAMVGLYWWHGRSSGVVHYTLAEVTQGNVVRSVTSTGTVNPILTITVGSYVSGVIKQLFCDYNTRVRQGQVCAKIDPRPYQTVVDQDRANLAMARAQLAKDRANLTYSEQIWQRNKGLLARGIVSQDVYDATLNSYQQASSQVTLDKASIEQRRAELAAAEINLGYTDIVSPVNGIVVSRNVTMGQTVAASFQTPTLFLIAADLTHMQVDTSVSESDIGGVHSGQTASFTVEAYPELLFSGKVSQVRQAPQTVQNIVTYDVVLDAVNLAQRLMPGMTATARIEVASRHNVLRVPDQALRYTPGRLAAQNGKAGGHAATAQVWVLRGGKPVRVPVKTGLDDDSYTEILAGALQPGEKLIVAEQQGGGSQARTPSLRF